MEEKKVSENTEGKVKDMTYDQKMDSMQRAFQSLVSQLGQVMGMVEAIAVEEGKRQGMDEAKIKKIII